jgi:hypothetical protein
VNAATLEAALAALTVEAIFGVSLVGQVYVADRARGDGNTTEAWFKPSAVEDVAPTGWGVPSQLHRYRLTLITAADTRANHRRMWGEAKARLHGRRAPVVAGLEVTTVGEVHYEQDGVGDTTAPLSSWAEITFKGDVLAAEMAANG